MEQTLQALAGILTKAIPTIIILVLLHQILKAVLFGPTEKMLKERGGMTHGARHAADASLKHAEHKTAEYEAKFRDARAVVYKEQEDTRRKWLDDQTQQLAQAKSAAETRVASAKSEITAEAAAARTGLQGTARELADQITTNLLARRSS